MKIKLPDAVKTIIQQLNSHGHEAYAVGGCVRDVFLGRQPADWDITTSAKPMEIKGIFRKTIDTGLQHGTVTVMIDHVGYEVTTYRIDGEYEDGRHPKQVEFTSELVKDLERRDFTINAMAYNETDGLVDEFDGIGDLERGIIRCVGVPGHRFDEDALRMLRAVRFSGQLGFRLEEKTRGAILSRKENLQKVSRERIRVELSKLLVSGDAGQLRVGIETGLVDTFLPELVEAMGVDQKNPHHIYTVGEHSIHGLEVMNRFFGKDSKLRDAVEIPDKALMLGQNIASNISEKEHLSLCLTMLLHDIAKPVCMTVDENGIGHFKHHPEVGGDMAKKILRKLTFDNDTMRLVEHLIQYHDYTIGEGQRGIRRISSRIGKENMDKLILVHLSDVLAQNPDTWEGKLELIYKAWDEFQIIMKQNQAVSIKELAINGKDLIELGVAPGKGMGEILTHLLEIVLENPTKNTRETLLELVKNDIVS